MTTITAAQNTASIKTEKKEKEFMENQTMDVIDFGVVWNNCSMNSRHFGPSPASLQSHLIRPSLHKTKVLHFNPHENNTYTTVWK